MCCCTKPAVSASTAITSAGTIFHVDDMTCSHCEGILRNAFKAAMPGVPVTIDLGQQRIIVDGDPAYAAAIIRDAGYHPVIVTA